jgi:two-component system chemotaxis sensor kinase CheA
MLLFRAGEHARLAVPLGLVARLEDFPRAEIEYSAGMPVVQYRGKLMKLVPFSGIVDTERARQPVLVFTDGGRSMGLMVDGITDVVEDRLHIELSGARPGLLGTAVIDGQATDVIDTGYWLQQAGQDWFQGRQAEADRRRRILMVDDNSFFRQLLVPTLSAAGYQVTAVESAADALALRDGGAVFDVILSDIDMPGMDGLAFARAVRSAGPWTDLPLIALSAAAEPTDISAGLDAGFTDYIAKSQRESLLASLAQGNAGALGATHGLAA